MTVPNIPQSIFNVDKTDYQNTSLFLGQKPGLFDTVNKQYPEIWKLYKTMKSLDWDENEFNYSDSAAEFADVTNPDTIKMNKALAWQWEQDSIATRTISFIVALFDPCSELWAAWQRVSDNETVHASTYSEVVRSCYKNAREVLDEILSRVEALQRMEVVSRELEKIRRRGLEYQLGLVPNDQETYNCAFMFAFVMLCMERLQFMSSFAVTFALGEDDKFIQPAKGIQKIATDEYEVHVELDRAVLANELQTERGQIAYAQMKPVMEEILSEVVKAEQAALAWIFEDGHELKYLNPRNGDAWIRFCATNIAVPYNLKMDFEPVTTNPLHYMKGWMKISDFQPSPQSEANGQYKVNLLRRDDEGVDFDTDF